MDAPPEVLDFFRRKELAPNFDWRDVWGEEHAHAFTVAGVIDAKVLSEFRAGIDKAIAEGKGFEAFREEMLRRLTPLGWWGPRDVADPKSGRVKRVDFSQARRLETTFWSNMRSARAAGQWERAQRTKAALPYFLYVRTTSAEPRADHLRFVGVILPVDDPAWRWMFPPNGWGCKCAVRQISLSQRDRYLDAARGADGIWYTDAAPPEDARPYVNRRTGERTMVPRGIDPGWHTNPGIGRAKTLGQQLVDRLIEQPPAVARAMVQRQVGSPGFESFIWRAQRREAQWSALSKADRADPAAYLRVWDDAPMPIAVLPDDLVSTLAPGRTVVTATDFSVAHNSGHHMAAWQWAQIQELIERGEVRRRRRDGALQIMMRIADDAKWTYLILAPDGKGGYRVATMMRAPEKYLAGQREDGDAIRAAGAVAEGRP